MPLPDQIDLRVTVDDVEGRIEQFVAKELFDVRPPVSPLFETRTHVAEQRTHVSHDETRSKPDLSPLLAHPWLRKTENDGFTVVDAVTCEVEPVSQAVDLLACSTGKERLERRLPEVPNVSGLLSVSLVPATAQEVHPCPQHELGDHLSGGSSRADLGQRLAYLFPCLRIEDTAFILEPTFPELCGQGAVQVLSKGDLHEPKASVEMRGQLRVEDVELDCRTVGPTRRASEPTHPGGGDAADERVLFVQRG